ncbi:ketopantoate reductase family protein [Leuconostoc falkenbergense]|uniref:ketopantoate reductase family protein n=1 Tax=Leuconostoc falkenbergense TaxID=2766470 RepID=UPI0021AA1963|nr:2-dehydropantoate 2-reductase [Leuconostoc falkenbergense]MCT4390295.1 2-dehydropantoate 2-reductase [Leuconostoc falkenbergense]
MKIAIAGFGALGARVGVMLQSAGHDVTGIDGWAAHISAINTKGLTVTEDDGSSKKFFIPVMTPKEVTGEFDLVILLTKTPQLDRMLTDIQPLITKQTQLLVLSNGLGNVEVMAKHVSSQQIIAGVTLWTSDLVQPGEIHVTGTGSIKLQAIDHADITAVVTALNEAGLNAEVSDNVVEAIWHKAGINSVLNPLTVLLDANIAEFGTAGNGMDLALNILDEIKQVGDVAGVNVDVNSILSDLSNLLKPENAGNHYPSMYQDIQAGKRTEIDFLNGYFAKLGRENHIATPFNALVTRLIHAKEDIERVKLAKQQETFEI